MKFSNHGFSQDFLKDVYKIMNGQPVEEKKKLDPVGKEDADIDNDGDTDKSDQYLHNRRKAIKKAMKEDTDIQELSKKTVGKYIKKATKSYADGAYQHGADPEHAQAGSETSAGDKSKTSHEMERRNKGIKTAVGKLTGTAKVKAKGKAKKWNKAPSHDMHSKSEYDGGYYGRYHEEFEDNDIQELSKKTVGKYIKKATKSYADGAYQHGADPEHAQAGSETSAGDKSKTSHEMERRNKGIKTAVGKLTGTSKVQARGKAKKWNKAPSHDMHKKTEYDGGYYGRYHEEFDIDEFVDSLSEAQLDEISAKLARMESVEEAKNAPSKENGGIAHQCATHVQHATYGEGRCIPGMHTIVETEEGEGFVTHYDVMFQGENGPVIVEDVSVNELKIIASESHKHSKRK